MTYYLIWLFLFLAGMVLVAVLTSRRASKSLVEYAVGGRRFGMVLVGLSEASGTATAWTYYAWAGLGYAVGTSVLWYTLFCTSWAVFFWYVMARRLRVFSEKLEAVTVLDYIAQRTGDPYRLIRTIGSAAMVFFLYLYASSQFLAIGKGMAQVFGLAPLPALIIGSGILVLYTLTGGMHGVAVAEAVQGMIQLLGLTLLPFLAISQVGGWRAFLAKASAVSPGFLTWHGGKVGLAVFIFILGWFSISIGQIGQPNGLVRAMTQKDPRLFHQTALLSLFYTTMRMWTPVLAGAACRLLYESLPNRELVFIRFVQDYLHPAIGGLFLVGIVCAAMTTHLLEAANTLSRNIYHRILRPNASESELVLASRVIVGLVGIAAMVAAWYQPRSLWSVITYAWTGLASSFGSVVLVSLYWRALTWQGALAGIVGGMGSTILYERYFLPLYPGVSVPTALVAFPVAFALIFIVSAVTRASQPGRLVQELFGPEAASM